jgi:hypothetical protein
MTRNKRTWTGLAAAALVICSTFSTGCDLINFFGTGFSVNLIVPMGLGGTPGFLNPFGITQALVNEALGLTTTESTAAFPVPSTNATTPVAVLPGLGPV